jgi:very-short-patch-repair endonuclease
MGKHFTTEDFIKRASLIHGDKYDYSKTNLKERDEKNRVIIICPIHGEFPQRTSAHLRGQGCPECNNRAKITQERFLERANKIHNNKYDYSKTEYKGIFDSIIITCPKHGDFKQLPSNHLAGCGCKECMKEKFSLGKEEFIKKAKKIHKDKYDYSKVNYINDKTEVTIICPKHGDFKQKPMKHLKGHGCQYCNESHLESEVRESLKNFGIEHKSQKKFGWLREKLELPLDFYLPKLNIVIECQGIQHFEIIEHFGGQKNYEIRVKRDKLKKQLCDEHGIELIYFTHEKVEEPYLGKVFTDINDLIEYIRIKGNSDG